MASPVVKTPAACLCSATAGGPSCKRRNFHCVGLISARLPALRRGVDRHSYRSAINSPSRAVQKFSTFATDGETVETKPEELVEEPVQISESEHEDEWNTEGAVGVEAFRECDDSVAEESGSTVLAYLNLYEDALANNDEAKATEVELFLKTLEDEKNDLKNKVFALSKELSYEKDQVLRISADFYNYRKRTEREHLSLITSAQGEVLEILLPVLDNFKGLKTQIKVNTEGEERINNGYQSMKKQFIKIQASLGAVPVDMVEKPFNPMVSFRDGSGFSQVIDELFSKLYKGCSGFMKT